MRRGVSRDGELKKNNNKNMANAHLDATDRLTSRACAFLPGVFAQRSRDGLSNNENNVKYKNKKTAAVAGRRRLQRFGINWPRKREPLSLSKLGARTSFAL